MSTTAPVKRDKFTFSNGDLFADVSGNFHRRAHVIELKAHFDNGTERDHPAHWFNAQLIHYGLKPSSTKAVARMRLYDAVREDKLVVPAALTALEKDMKKEWDKNNRDAKKSAKCTTTAPAAPAATPATKKDPKLSKAKAPSATPTAKKRKAEEEAATQPSIAKKAKPIPTLKPSHKTNASEKPKEKPKAKSGGKDQPAPKASKPKAGPKVAASLPNTNSATHPEPPMPRQMARCSRGGASTSRGRGGLIVSTSSQSEMAAPPRTKQTARRSNILATGRNRTSSTPRTKQTARRGTASIARGSSSSHIVKLESSDEDSESDAIHHVLRENEGFFSLQSDEISGGWPMYEDFELELAIEGSIGWGRFELGIVSGVLKFDDYLDQDDRLNLTWRGREAEGPIVYGNSHRGWLEFAPHGDLHGCIDFMGIHFRGSKVGPCDGDQVASMIRYDWQTNYTEEQYEYESVNRWR